MQKIMLGIITLMLLAAGNFSVNAQNTDAKKPEKEETTTVNVWREALPLNEEPYYKSQIDTDKKDGDVGEETAADIEKEITILEQNFSSAHQQRDPAVFRNLISEDFMPAGINLGKAKPNKAGYIAWALKNSELQSYAIEKIKVRIYGTTALATVNYKKTTVAADSSANNGISATDVWIKRGTQWQLVSHQISQSSNP